MPVRYINRAVALVVVPVKERAQDRKTAAVSVNSVGEGVCRAILKKKDDKYFIQLESESR